MSKEISEQHSKLSTNEKMRYSEIREKIVAQRLGWNRIAHQWINGQSDFIIPGPEKNKAEMKTDFRMDETKQYFLEIESWEKQSPHNKFWAVCQATQLEKPDIVWVLSVDKLKNSLTEFSVIPTKSPGYAVPVEWLETNAERKEIFS